MNGREALGVRGDEAELSEPEQLVLAEIRACPGLDFALPVDALATRVAIDDRTVQQLVKHLIEAHGYPIGSATGAPHGYYWITTAEEQALAEQQLENRIKSTAIRLSKLRRNTPAEILDQLALNLRDAPHA